MKELTFRVFSEIAKQKEGWSFTQQESVQMVSAEEAVDWIRHEDTVHHFAEEELIQEDKPKFEKGDYVWDGDLESVSIVLDSDKEKATCFFEGVKVKIEHGMLQLATKAQIREAHDFKLNKTNCRIEDTGQGTAIFRLYLNDLPRLREVEMLYEDAKAIAEKFGTTVMPELGKKYK